MEMAGYNQTICSCLKRTYAFMFHHSVLLSATLHRTGKSYHINVTAYNLFLPVVVLCRFGGQVEVNSPPRERSYIMFQLRF